VINFLGASVERIDGGNSMRIPPVLPALAVTLLVSYPAAQAHDRNHGDRGGPPGFRPAAPPDVMPIGPGRLRNRALGMCLDAAGWAAPGGANVLLWSCNNDPDHVWSFTPSGEIKNTQNGLCLTIADKDRGRDRGRRRGRDRDRPRRGDDVGIDACDGSRSQQWAIVARGRDNFEVRHGRELCLDVEGRRGAQGDDVLLWDCDGGSDQTWSWEPTPQRPPTVVFRQPSQPDQPYTRPRQPPARAQPVPPRAPVAPMAPPAFQALLDAIRSASFSANQIAVIEQAAGYNHFLVSQLKQIVTTLSFSANQVRAVELIAPRLVDPQNGYQLFDAFTFSGDKERVKSILDQARQPPPPPPPPPYGRVR
jgi:hypothetical protein